MDTHCTPEIEATNRNGMERSPFIDMKKARESQCDAYRPQQTKIEFRIDLVIANNCLVDLVFAEIFF